MDLQKGDYVIVFESVGYATQKRNISIDRDQVLNMALASKDEILEQVVVRSDREDPAYGIIRSAIEKRKDNLEAVTSFRADCYIRAVLEEEDLKRPDTIQNELITRKKVNLIESQSKVYYLDPGFRKEIKTAYRDLSEQKNQTTGFSVGVSAEDDRGPQSVAATNPLLFFTKYSDGDFNFYKNLIDLPVLSSSPYTSPIANNALLVYRYRFIESFMEDDVLVHKIEVLPKFQGGRLFKGIVYVEDGSFKFKAVDLELNHISLLYFSKFRLLQNFKNSDKGSLIQRQEFYYETQHSKNKASFGRTLVQYDNYELNVELSKRFMARGQTIFTDSSAEKTEAYWSGMRPITLKPVEKAFIHTQDSIIEVRNSAGYIAEQDSIYNNLDIWNFLVNGIVHRNRAKATNYLLYPLIAQLQFNLIDGYRHTLGGVFSKEWSKAQELELSGDISYGFLNENIRGELTARYLFKPKTFSRVRLRYANKYTMLTTYESIAGTFAPSNYVENEGYGIGFEREWWNGFFVRSYLDYNQYRPYKGELLEALWEGFPTYNNPQDFEGFEQLVLNITADITFAQQYEMRPYKKVITGSKFPTLQVNYRKGIKPFLGSDVNYDFLELRTDHDFKLRTAGLSRISARAGGFINDQQVRLADLKYFRGSDQIFFSNPLRSFQQISPTAMSTSKAYFQGHYIHHFNGAILGKIPTLNRWSIYAFGGGSVLLMEQNDVHHLELYAGLEKPFRLWRQLFRVSASYVTSEGSLYGFDRGVKFGIDFYNTISRSWMY